MRKFTDYMAAYDRSRTRNPLGLLLFRMGDFYEAFDQDARTIATALGIALTSSRDGRPMAGVPAHALEDWVNKLSDAGHRVVIGD